MKSKEMGAFKPKSRRKEETLFTNSARQACWEFMQDVQKRDGYVNLEIEGLYRRLEPKDRSFITELVFGSTRMRRRLDFEIDSHLERSVDDETRQLLRLGYYEAFFMKTAEHAIVHEYVEVAKVVLGKARASFVNALLRRATRERGETSEKRELPIGVSTSHPDWIVDVFSMISSGEDLVSELASHNVPAEIHAVSFLPLADEDAIKEERSQYGYILRKPPHLFDEIVRHRAFVQDLGSQIICEIMLGTDAKRNLRWLDLCAGPGGKFAFLAHFLSADQLQGCEIHPHRAKLISQRCPDHKISIVDSRESGLTDANFDRILIDAPCTGLGALRRRPDARWRRSELDLKNLIKLQQELLESAAQLLAPGGIIGYATCSPHPLETRVQVADFLAKNPSFKQISIEKETLHSTFHSGIGVDGAMQLMTSSHGTDGMFLALLKKEE